MERRTRTGDEADLRDKLTRMEKKIKQLFASDVEHRLADVGVIIEPSNAHVETTPRAVLDRRGFDFIHNFDTRPFDELLDKLSQRMKTEVKAYRTAKLAQSTMNSYSDKRGSGKQTMDKRGKRKRKGGLSPGYSGKLEPIFNFDDKRWGHPMFSDLKEEFCRLKKAIVKTLEDHWGIKGGNKHETVLFSEEEAELQAPHADYENIFKMRNECKRLSYSVFLGIEPRQVWRMLCFSLT